MVIMKMHAFKMIYFSKIRVMRNYIFVKFSAKHSKRRSKKIFNRTEVRRSRKVYQIIWWILLAHQFQLNDEDWTSYDSIFESFHSNYPLVLDWIGLECHITHTKFKKRLKIWTFSVIFHPSIQVFNFCLEVDNQIQESEQQFEG